MSKNILRRQNPLELVLEDISIFDAENPIIGSPLRELDVGEKYLSSDLIKQAPTPPETDFAIRNQLNRLRDREEPITTSISSSSSSWYVSWIFFTTSTLLSTTTREIFRFISTSAI